MELIYLIIFLLISVASSQLWSNSKICGYIRRFIVKIPFIRDVLLCPSCSSFWIAMFVSLFFNPLIGLMPYIVSNIAISIINYAICGILFKRNILTSD